MSRALPKYNKRRVVMIGGAVAVVLSGAVITGSALAGQSSNANNPNNANNQANGPTQSAASTVNCPDVASRLRSVPAAAQAEVSRKLAQLNSQIQEANNRLAAAQGNNGQGGNGEGGNAQGNNAQGNNAQGNNA
ncbi:hypothetical protein AB0959_38780, partial [Streptomyces sp. NPDC046862]